MSARPGFLETFRQAGLYQQMIVLYGVLYAVASLSLEVGGIIGFSKTPYLNAIGYALAGLVILWAFAANRVTLSVFRLSALQLAVLAVLAIATIIGIANGNAPSYIIAWNVYILVAVIMVSVFRHGRDQLLADPLGLIYSWPFMAVMLVAAALSVFSKDNLYQYMLMEVLALGAMVLRRGLFIKIAGAILFLLIHLGSRDGFVQVEINRASILAIGVTGLIYLIYRRRFVTILFAAIAAVAGLFYALSLDDATIEDLPRNIREAIQLMKGDDLYNHVSSYQRVYEGWKVMEDFEGGGPWEMALGKGLGRTIDMSGAADRTVGQHALLGVLEVHNIHFVHFALIHKFGVVGLVVFLAMVATILALLVRDMASGRLDDGLFFFYLYVIYVIVFAFPASNHMIGNPLFGATIGMLLRLRTGGKPLPAPHFDKPPALA